jgi:hypothetical protein
MPAPQPMQVMQGIEVPATSVNPARFFELTRRLTILEKNLAAFAGLGSTDVIPILQTGVLSGLMVQFSGQLVITTPTGSVATTGRWPYDMIRAARFSANGQSNLINCHGSPLKAREVMHRGDLTDRGVSRGVGGASPGTATTQGTLSLNSENWGVGQNVTAIPAATYPVELEWYIPVAFDDLTLSGAIFAQTSATDLALTIDWAPPTDLFVIAGTATATLTGALNCFARLYTIPQGPDGNIIVPDLSTFHSLIESRQNVITNGDNEVRLAGQGVGKQLLRMYGRVFNTAVANTPVPLQINSTNFGQMLWRFGGNDTPEVFTNGFAMDHNTEKMFDCDLGASAGYWVWDFASENAFRDSVDEGTATELRWLVNVQGGVALTNAFAEYVQETVSVGSAA